MAVERLGGPRDRGDFTTVPADDYRRQYALLVAEITAVAEDGFDTAEQKRTYFDEVIPAWEAVRNVDDKINRRGLLAIRIAEARNTFRRVMGEHWQPSAENTVARAARARGLDITTPDGPSLD
ncbi:hypothetical protein [Gordonia sp. NPDC003376]